MNKNKTSRQAVNANTSECSERDGSTGSGPARRPGRKPKPKARMGRPPKLVNQIERAMSALDANLPMLIDKLIELAYVKGDKDVLMYLVDRKMGRPASQVNANVKGVVIAVSPDDYAKAITSARLAEQTLLAMPTLLEESVTLPD